ncbi:hypothetical protein HJG60_010007 [Phyllostomus discolor]|uniref:Uncharacterized protein n=1 Tax=Phyllostomus discolor TaxID=89673 RepID=A0A834DAB5_9CHIR|nr:hypothetical protein HJG60_010007 [Phyllostomus discolor]
MGQDSAGKSLTFGDQDPGTMHPGQVVIKASPNQDSNFAKAPPTHGTPKRPRSVHGALCSHQLLRYKGSISECWSTCPGGQKTQQSPSSHLWRTSRVRTPAPPRNLASASGPLKSPACTTPKGKKKTSKRPPGGARQPVGTSEGPI